MNTLKLFKQQLQKLAPYMARYRKWEILTVVFILLKEGAILFEPDIYREIVTVFEKLFAQNITHEQVVHQVALLIGGFIGLQAVVIVSHICTLRAVNHLETSVMRDAANDFVGRVLNLSFRFHSQRKTGKMAKEFARGINGIESFLDAFIFNLIPLTVRIFVIFVVFLFINVWIGLTLLGMATVFCTFTVYATLRMQRKRQRANRIEDEGSRKAMDALMNAEAVKYFQQETQEIRAFRVLQQQWKTTKKNEWDSWMWISAGQILINVTAVTVILLLMISRLFHGELNLPDFVFVISYLGLAIGMLWDFQHHIRRFQESFTDVSAFFSYYDEENEIKDLPNARPLEITRGEIMFDHVTFAYQKEKSVLEDVSFTVPAGKSVAFVGPSGVGKSTVMKLLYRFYDPQNGRICIDGQEIMQVKQKSLREALSIVPQETALFNETIAYNIAYGRKDVNRAEIEHAARLANLEPFIARLPQGYDTMVGERGVKLSGGEKQRISIARAFLRNSPILVLDEATSSLDSAAEAEIQTALKQLMHNRTTLIIAHRLSTIMHADLIFVLKDGKIEQQGTHDELLKNGGLYMRLWELQAGGYIQ